MMSPDKQEKMTLRGRGTPSKKPQVKFVEEAVKKTEKRIKKAVRKAMARAIDNVNHPRHYTRHPSGIECIEVTRHMGFNLGNAMKYIWRADEKGNAIEDLQKARWYIEDEIKKRQCVTDGS